MQIDVLIIKDQDGSNAQNNSSQFFHMESLNDVIQYENVSPESESGLI